MIALILAVIIFIIGIVAFFYGEYVWGILLVAVAFIISAIDVYLNYPKKVIV